MLRSAVGRRAHEAVRTVRCRNRVISRYPFNGARLADYRRNPASLGPQAADVAAALRARGVAMTTIDAIVSDPQLIEDLFDESAALRAAPQPMPDPLKPFLLELLGSTPMIRLADAVVRFALDPLIRGIAERYSGLRLHVQDINIWVNQPSPGGPQQSQRWHRDVPEDHDIVKCFVYLDDVPLGAGPLQYIAGSNTPAGRRRRMRTEFDRGGYRLSDEAIADSFNENDIVVSQGPAGTVVFADTRGIHRGGHAIDRERFVLQITYASAASVKRRTLRAAADVDRSQLAGVRLVD